jgi:hypothetical protein
MTSKLAVPGIDLRNVLRFLGYIDGRKPTQRILSMIWDYARHINRFVDRSYSYVIKEIDKVEESLVVIDGGIEFESTVVASLLEQCSKVGLFVVTIGGRLEDMARRLADEGLVLHAHILDAIGSDAVEQCADLVQHMIRRKASEQGLFTSRRFSPGYCDWEIGQQREFFHAMTGKACGVRLTESGLMVPQKSISGIIGIGDSPYNVTQYNPCLTCSKKDCRGRR